ncbi:hypothetical protein GKZ68_09980 [Hymenobacter sp. BRD128]|uniref:hypothetical protein n=1 Tax=Hymenobacter sp. BRD128 TaxID=2675878 RepID=UPI0015677EA6|nr:hypothetical protein [Hymenobacter sp. BRD128]QKG56927.1 hypothetical protein GKZ68_09980 [Hymenobacter sp. BRD128]
MVHYSTTLPLPAGLLRRGAVLLILLVGSLFASSAHAQTWMVSTTPYIKLGVLDKYNALGGYTAVFIVTNEKNGQEYLLTKQIAKGENGVDVFFPTEPSDPEYFKNTQGLAAQPTPGRYHWECRVNGKKAVGGFFNFPETGNDITVIGGSAQR